MNMDEVAVAAWGHFLADVPAPILEGIVVAWIKREAKPPSIAELLERVRAFGGKGGEESWKRVRQIVLGGRYRGADGKALPRGFTDDPAMEAAVDVVGGWRKIGAMDDKELTWAKKEYLDAYAKAIQDSQVRLAVLGGPAGKELGHG